MRVTRRAFLFFVFLFPVMGHAQEIQDYGVRGHTFPIQEKSLLQVIKERLQAAEESGKMEALQAQFKERVKKKVSNPCPVKGLRRTETPRAFFFDPSLTQNTDIKDHNGRIVVTAGTYVNPLDHVSWGAPLLFIDGEDEDQVIWALKQQGKVLLVKGSPLLLQETYDHWFYFDQAGQLSEKFGLTQVPARVSQEGKFLKVEELRP